MPGSKGVGGLPESSAGQTDVDDSRVPFDHRDVVDASAHDGGSNFTKLQVFDGRFERRLAAQGGGHQEKPKYLGLESISQTHCSMITLYAGDRKLSACKFHALLQELHG